MGQHETKEEAAEPEPAEAPTLKIKWLSNTADFLNYRISGVGTCHAILDVRHEETVQRLVAMVRANGDCIRFAQYRRVPGQDTVQTRFISLAQLGGDILHCNLCLGDGVSFLGEYPEFGVAFSQIPCGRHLWEVRTLPFERRHIEGAVRLMVDTVLRCHEGKTYYSTHPIYNVQHAVCRVMRRDHAMFDLNSDSAGAAGADYDYDKPRTWNCGLHCSQLVLLVLKRCIGHGLLKIEDESGRAKFMDVNSHTCLPGALHILIQEAWPSAASRFDTIRLHLSPYDQPAQQTAPLASEGHI